MAQVVAASQSVITYTCYGAAREVTGSCHLLESGGRRLLVDCGLFQGGREQDRANAEPFGFDPASIDVLLLTHAHLDHCGRIPKLVKEGFHGRILATAATRDLARIVMLDAASLQEEDPFAMSNLHFRRDTADSMAINPIESGAIILAGSGMCTGGRVLHHLKHNLWRERCSVMFVGYAAEGSLARRIVDGAAMVRIYGEDVRVKAQVWTINGFSAHADQPALLDWLGNEKRQQVLLVHGEYERGMRAMEARLVHAGVACRIPNAGESIVLKRA